MSGDDLLKAISCTTEDIESWEQPEQKRPDGCGHVWYWSGSERRCKGCIPEPPKGPPNQHCKSLTDPHAYDVVTGDAYIDREIARQRGLYPRPWWWRIRRWWRGGTDSMGNLK